jgi:hypothetical protein
MKLTIEKFAPVTQDGLQKVEEAIYHAKYEAMSASEVRLLHRWAWAIEESTRGRFSDYKNFDFCLRRQNLFETGDGERETGERIYGRMMQGDWIPDSGDVHQCNGKPMRDVPSPVLTKEHQREQRLRADESRAEREREWAEQKEQKRQQRAREAAEQAARKAARTPAEQAKYDAAVAKGLATRAANRAAAALRLAQRTAKVAA